MRTTARLALRVLLIVAILSASLALLSLFTDGYQRAHLEIDVHSGRERELWGIWWVGLRATERETDLSRLAEQAGVGAKKPEWRRIHTAGGQTRIHYRFADIAVQLLNLPPILESYELADSDRFRFARAAIRCLETDRQTIVNIEDDGRTLLLKDIEGAVVETAAIPK